ncbi:MAG: tetratricopeptide repeat protein [Planctomycetes bacterium]|nr:tetratricopeptide repeat protein [Planctomycetota bacterium]
MTNPEDPQPDDQGHPSDSWISLGFQQLRDGDFEDALKTAQKVEELRASAAFEIAAQAHANLGDPEAALQVLERGVREAPNAWPNWQLLGNLYADAGRFDDAENAYRDALQCAHVWPESVHLNQAILLGQQGNHDRALVALDAIKDDDLLFELASARMNALYCVEKTEEALALAETILVKEPQSASDEDAWYFISVIDMRIRMAQGLSAQEVRDRALALLVEYPENDHVLALIRDTRDERSRDCKYYRLVIQGNTLDAPASVEGFYIPYDVVAESEEEAMTYIEEVEALTGFNHLEIEESEILVERSREPKGLYRAGTRTYFEGGE